MIYVNLLSFEIVDVTIYAEDIKPHKVFSGKIFSATLFTSKCYVAMSKLVGDFIIDRLAEWNVTRIFGYPGDGINGIMGALNRAGSKIEFIQTRHEEMAAFMACGHAKFTSEVGVCLATSGPGAIHLLNGLYDAKMDHQPVVAIVGQQARASIGGDYQQEVDLLSLFKDVAHEYVHMCSVPSQIRHLVDRAVRIAISNRTVTCIIIPNDVQELPYEEPQHVHSTIHSGLGHSKPEVIPAADDIVAAAQLLNNGKKVAMLVGAGAFNAADEIIEVANLLGAGVAKALLGKAVLPDNLSFVTGAIGLLGTKPSYDLMMECDTLLMVGTSFPYSEFLPKEGQAKAVQIDLDGRMLGLRYPTNINLQGDSKRTLQALIPLLKRKADRSWQEHIINEIERWWKVVEARAMNSAHPINPQRVFWELSSRLPDDCIITADSGSSASWFARDLKIREGMKASLSGNLASMCPGVPYAIAAKFAYPHRMPIALVGDGAMQMLGINGMITIAKYWKQWKDPRLMILVLNNRDLNMVTWEQRVLVGDPKFEASQDLPDFNYAAYAHLLGLEGLRVEKPNDIESAIDYAMQADRPVVLDVVTDPNVPPLPPHISIKQAKAFASSVLKGDEDSWEMIKQTYKDVVESYLPH
jgi:pyruvate dehydrogenase (quinone)